MSTSTSSIKAELRAAASDVQARGAANSDLFRYQEQARTAAGVGRAGEPDAALGLVNGALKGELGVSVERGAGIAGRIGGVIDPDMVRDHLKGTTLLDQLAPMLLVAEGANWLSTEDVAADMAFLMKQNI